MLKIGSPFPPTPIQEKKLANERAGKNPEPIPSSLMNVPTKDTVFFGYQSAPKPPLTYKLDHTLPIKGFGNVDVYKFSNGLELYAAQRGSLPLFAYGVLAKTGAGRETERTSGLAHFLEHLIYKGSENIPPGKADQIMEQAGAKINAFTGYDETFYYAYYAPQQALNPVIDTYADIIQNPAFPNEETDNERGAVLDEESRWMNNPYDAAFELSMQHILAGMPYQWSVLGRRENIKGPNQVTREDLLSYHRQGYAPNNMAILVMGQFDIKQVLDRVARTHNQLQPIANPDYKPAKLDASWAKKELHLYRNDISNAILTLTLHGPEPHQAGDEKELAAWKLLMSILTEGKTGRLHKRLVEQHQLASEVSPFLFHTTKLVRAGSWHITASSPDNMGKIRAQVKDEIRKIRKDGVQPEELRRAKLFWENELAETSESQLHSFWEFAFAVSQGSLEHSFGNEMEAIQSVTTEDIRKAAQKYLADDAMVVTETLPSVKPNVPEQATNPDKTRKTDSMKFGGKLTEKDQSFRLPGGGEVIVREIPESSRVAVSLLMRGGSNLQTLPGETELLAEVLERRTARLSAEAFQKELEKDGLELDVYSAPDRLEISMSGLPYFKEKMFALLKEVVTNPSFDEKDITFIKKLAKENYEAAADADKEEAVAEKLAQKLFPNSHPYAAANNLTSLPGSAFQHIDQITPGRLEQLYRQMLNQADVTMAVTGNLEKIGDGEAQRGAQTKPAKYTPNEIAKMAGAVIKDLPTGTALPRFLETTPPKESSTLGISKEGITQSNIVRGWHGPSFKSEDYAALRIICAIMAGGMQTRMFQAFRGDGMEALSYGPKFDYRAMENGGLLWYTVSTDTQHTKTVLDKIQQETERLLTTQPSPKEMRTAKLFLETTLPLQEEKTDGTASYLTLHRGLSRPSTEELLEQIERVTPEQIQKVAQRYLGQPSVTYVQAPKSILEKHSIPPDQ